MHVPIEEYKDNLIQIVKGFQDSAPDANILLVTPPHIDDSARAKSAAERNDTKKGLVDRTNAMATNYSRACVEAAETLGVPVLDLNTHFNAMPEPTRNALLVDGLHLSADGHKAVDEQLRNKIKADFPNLDKALQMWQFPAASQWASEDPWTASS